MFKQSLINFFKNLKYCFTSLGTLFLGVLFGVCFLFSGAKAQIKQAANDVGKITAEANIDPEDFKKCLTDSFSQISWNDPIAAIKTITSKEWIDGTLKANLENTIENYKLYAKDIEKAISRAIKGYSKYIALFATCSIIGLIGGFFLTRYLVRQSITKKAWRKFVLVTILDSVLIIGVTMLSVYLTMLWQPSIIFVSIASIILYGFLSLLEAYLVHAYKCVPFASVVNLKNVMLLFCANLLIYLIVFAISALAILITNAFVGIFIALPLLIIAINVISLNAESYILSLGIEKPRKKSTIKKQAE